MAWWEKTRDFYSMGGSRPPWEGEESDGVPILCDPEIVNNLTVFSPLQGFTALHENPHKMVL